MSNATERSTLHCEEARLRLSTRSPKRIEPPFEETKVGLLG